MNKVATYLNEHLQGEAIASAAFRQKYATDTGVLTITPDLIALPVNTNDIRKITRFAWQLAEKGHVLPVTARGQGGDATGASLGGGVVIDLHAKMNRLQEVDVKQKLIRVEAGAEMIAVNASLWPSGLGIPVDSGTAGGAIATNAHGKFGGKYGPIGDYVSQLEVILSSGDVLQTGRLSKREVSQKKGLQTFEGEIYRSIDNLINDNQSLVTSLVDQPSKSGYSGIANVRHKDGSIDLGPLFVGSQGTLGVISEAILRTNFTSRSQAAVVMAFSHVDDARDWLDELVTFEPAAVEFYDNQLLQAAIMQGKKYNYVKPEVIKSGAIVVACFDDFSERARGRHVKKLTKRLQATGKPVEIHTEYGEYVYDDLAIHAAPDLAYNSDASSVAPTLLRGAYVPLERFDDFLKSLKKLALHHEVTLPVYYDVLTGILNTEPLLDFSKVSQRQKAVKILADFSALVNKIGGSIAADIPEGRLRTALVNSSLDDDVRELYASIKQIFDPYSILNPGVKQAGDIKALLKQIDGHKA